MKKFALAMLAAVVATVSFAQTTCDDPSAPNHVYLSTPDFFAAEGVTWQVTNENGDIVLSGGLPVDVDACLADGCYTATLIDQNGEEYNFLFLTVTDDEGNILVDYQWDLGSTWQYSISFCLDSTAGLGDCPPGDFDCNLTVGLGDLFAILADYGCTEACSCDINGDGVTNTADILEFLTAYFAD